MRYTQDAVVFIYSCGCIISLLCIHTRHLHSFVRVFTKHSTPKSHNAPVPHPIMRHFVSEMCTFFSVTTLFKCVFESGVYPDKWYEGIISPINKQESWLLAEIYMKIIVSSNIDKPFDTDEDQIQNGCKEKKPHH